MVLSDTSLRQVAYERIKRRILTGELTAGAPLSEKDLVSILGISRTPIREAIGRLEQENFLEVFPKRGIFVSRLSYEDIRNIYVIRLQLEPFAVRLAVPNISEEELHLQRSIWTLPGEPGNADDHIHNDRNLHHAIFQATHNKYLVQVLDRLYDQATRIRYLSLNRAKSRQDDIHREHVRVIDALLTRDADAAERAMQDHLEHARDTALQVFS